MSEINNINVNAILFSDSKQSELEDKLRRWAKPPSETEIGKCDRAVRMIKAAISADAKLSQMDIEVYAKGSYANRTNIPSDSDVDVAVVLTTLFFNDYPPGTQNEVFGFITSNYSFEEFKKEVSRAVVSYFGYEQVTVGNKAIQVHSNSARVDADVVPHFAHRRYAADKTFLEGVALKTESELIIKNWPDQDYNNGVAKNESTSKRYKGLVRILKNLRGEMRDEGFVSAKNAPSYLIACLVWNIPNSTFEDESYSKMVEDSLKYLVACTSDPAIVKEWGEVNELKYLFAASQGWKLNEVHLFLVEALWYFKSLK